MTPTAQTIGHQVWSAGATDAHGNPVDQWADAVDVAVYGYGPPVRTEEAEQGGTQVVQGLQVLAPTFPVDPRDRFVIDSKVYEQIGESAVWDNGPFGFVPGMLLRVKRVQGGR